MTLLIRDVADIGQMDTGRFVVERKPTDVSSLVREVVATLQPAAAQRGSQLKVEISDAVPSIDADGDRIV